jgi:hypothetical protein
MQLQKMVKSEENQLDYDLVCRGSLFPYENGSFCENLTQNFTHYVHNGLNMKSEKSVCTSVNCKKI